MNTRILLMTLAGLVQTQPCCAQVAFATRSTDVSPFKATTVRPRNLPSPGPAITEPTISGPTVSGPTNPPQRLLEPAPMPDADLYPPVPHNDNPRATQLTPSLFQPKNQWRGDGFSPGSTVQGSQEKQLKPAPGFSMKVPLN